MCVLRNDNVRKIDITIPKIIGHKGEVTDFDFSPFDDGKILDIIINFYFIFRNCVLIFLDIIVTGSDDRLIRIWRIPEDFKTDLIEANLVLSGHQKKIQILQFNPVAENIVASTS